MSPFKWGFWAAASVLSVIIVEIDCDIIVETREARRPFRIYEDQPARFGDALPSDGLVGMVIQANPSHGCSPIAPPPNISLPHNIYFIAIIERSIPGAGNESGCTFQEKVENAQISHYSGAIVYNYLDDELIPMGGDADVLIPSVFVGKSDGEKIISHFSYPNLGFVVRITENAPFDINSYLLPFAIVVGICFIIMLGIMVFKCIQDRRRERRHRLPKSSLKKIPTKKFQVGDELHYETCCICLDDFEVGDKLRVLPCEHVYHMKCIDPWLLKNKRVCPQCRKKVFASGEVPPSDSESETEDERAPLLARPRHTEAGTFSTQNENPFRRAARRLTRAGNPSQHTQGTRTVSPGGVSRDSSSTESGELTEDNHLITEVQVERPRMQESPQTVLTVHQQWSDHHRPAPATAVAANTAAATTAAAVASADETGGEGQTSGYETIEGDTSGTEVNTDDVSRAQDPVV